MSKWISVKKKVPPRHEGDGKPTEYLVYRQGFTGINADKNGYEIMPNMGQASWSLVNMMYGFGITHWMPLPEPPND